MDIRRTKRSCIASGIAPNPVVNRHMKFENHDIDEPERPIAQLRFLPSRNQGTTPTGGSHEHQRKNAMRYPHHQQKQPSNQIGYPILERQNQANLLDQYNRLEPSRFHPIFQRSHRNFLFRRNYSGNQSDRHHIRSYR